MSVFHRRMQERTWTREQYQTAANQLGRDDTAQYWTWVPVSSFLIGAASQLYLSLPENVFLRASDCLHLVTALHHGFEELCTFDRHQFAAAQGFGLAVIKLWRLVMFVFPSGQDYSPGDSQCYRDQNQEAHHAQPGKEIPDTRIDSSHASEGDLRNHDLRPR
jgi:PIN domain